MAFPAALCAPARSLRALAERLCERLADPARRERTAMLVLVAYTVIWALYGAISKGAQDIHFDMVEVVGWSRELALGYPKHPPVAPYLARLWFSVFPIADWSYYLLAIATVAVALWFCWKIAGDYLGAEKRVVAFALLTLVPFFNFHALKFNVNTVMVPLWAATAWFFLRAFETRRPHWAALAGIAAGLAMATKYWSIFLLLGLGIAALLDRRRIAFLRSPAPWITIAAGALVIAPHLWWLAQSNFAPFIYAIDVHGKDGFFASLVAAAGYLLGAVAYVIAPLALVFFMLRPSAAAARDSVFPADDARRLAVAAFALPILLPALLAPLASLELTSLWTMPAWALLPVVLLSSPLVTVMRDAATRVMMIALAFPVIMLALSPAISVAIHWKGVKPSAQAHSKLLAREITRAWRATTDKPLRLVGGDGDLAYGTAFYLKSRPSVFPWFSAREAPWITETRIARDGIALVCVKVVRDCVQLAEQMAAKSPAGQRVEPTIVRRHFGIAGPAESYVIITIPPR